MPHLPHFGHTEQFSQKMGFNIFIEHYFHQLKIGTTINCKNPDNTFSTKTNCSSCCKWSSPFILEMILDLKKYRQLFDRAWCSNSSTLSLTSDAFNWKIKKSVELKTEMSYRYRCSGYHYFTTALNTTWIQVQCSFNPSQNVLEVAMVRTFNSLGWKKGLTIFVGQPFHKNKSSSPPWSS